MQLSRLEPKRRKEYNYNISSNKTGVFETMTIIRIGGSASKIQDIDVPLNVEMKPPEFYVYLDREASFASANKNFTVTYNIIHKSGWCDEPFKQNVSFKLSHDGEYEIFHDGKCYHGGPIPTTFSVFRNAAIKIIIHYNKSGVHLLPAILVENEVQPFEDKEITVFSSDSAKWMDENQATISNLGVPIAFVVSLFSFFSRYVILN